MNEKQQRSKNNKMIRVAIIITIIAIGIAITIIVLAFSFPLKLDSQKELDKTQEPSSPEYALKISILSMNKTTIEEYRLDYHDFVNVSYYIFEVKIENIGQESLYVSYLDFYLLTNINEKIDPTNSNLSSELIKGTWISGTVKFDLDVNYDYSKLDKLVFDKSYPYLYDIHEEWEL